MTLSSSQIIIQSICTTWTKISRGGAEASIRNTTPDVFTLPDAACQAPHTVFLIHEVTYTEYNHFQQPRQTLEQKEKINSFRCNCLKLTLHEQALDVTLEWERSKGAPRRHTLPRAGFCLQNGQWGCVTYNLRTAWKGCWAYKKYVLNVGLFPHISPEVFLTGKPTHTYRDMAQLR